ncbi:MAG TPA: hypothetical protein VNN20_03100 [Thermodesulfobacteriota bacterium]|nr:hypothetical protein [Thermodesulfobacteriota bacterium]
MPVQAPWWASFNDVKLNVILNEVLYNNFDVAQALARFEQASALTKEARAARFAAAYAQGLFGVEWRITKISIA